MKKMIIPAAIIAIIVLLLILWQIGAKKSYAPSPAILPADSEFPTSGICAEPGNAAAVQVEINQDIPSPRCQKVDAGKRLNVKNNTGSPLLVWFGKNKEYSFSVPANGEYETPQPMNEFLTPGVHILYGSPYPGPELWLFAGQTAGKDQGTIRGKVLLGPTCPVVKNPPDPNCADKPYRTAIQIIKNGSPSNSPYATAESDGEGRYEITIPAGEYALQPIGGNPLPRCETKNAAIEPNETKEINLSCDTGIR